MATFVRMLHLEWRLNRKIVLINLLMAMAFSVFMVRDLDSRRIFFFFSVSMATLLALTLYTRSDRFRGDLLLCSLPLSRRQVIRSKYFNTVFWSTVFLVGNVTAGMVAHSGKVISFAGMTSVALAHLFFLMALIIVFFVPFIVRFGFMGMIYFMVACQLLGIGLILLARVGKPPKPLREVIASVLRFFGRLKTASGSIGYLLLLAAASFLLLWASYRVSLLLFKRKDL